MPMPLTIGSERVLLVPSRLPIDYYARKFGLVSEWHADENGGLALDAYATNHLSATNNPVGVAGKIGQARQFVAASSQYASVASNATLRVSGVSFGIALWVNLVDVLNYMVLVSKWAGDPNGEYLLDTNTTGAGARFTFRVAPQGGGHKFIAADSFGAPSTGVWHFVLAWQDSLNNTINIRVNHGNVDSVAYTGPVNNGANPLQIGKDHTTNNYVNGSIDNVALFKSPPGGIAGVINEISAVMWNGGAGRQLFPFAG